MPLVAHTLETGLKNAFAVPRSSVQEAAHVLAAAYDAYASQALFMGGTLVPVVGRLSTMVAALSAGFAARTFDAGAAAWASALSTYWTAAPIVGAVTGATNGCPGASMLPGVFTTIFATPPARDSVAVASLLAGALHTATKTVMATVTIPSVPPVTSVVPIL